MRFVKCFTATAIAAVTTAIISSSHAWAQADGLFNNAQDCGDMQVWDVAMNMCMPYSMKGMPMTMLMIHENAFVTGIAESGPRGRSTFASPNMFMTDIGTSFGDRQYLNLDYMGTLERWTFPDGGYPLLLQTGEENAQGTPYIDAQHPHSSPVMGLTLSDTVALGLNKSYLKLFFAPRGESTDGPVAFMHRPTGVVNPDVPLGHHIGQDVGHITSTVVGTSLKWNAWRVEFSTFNGTEPSPTAVDLPIGRLNSWASRLMADWADSYRNQWTLMGSIAFVQDSDLKPSLSTTEWRSSGSLMWSRHQSDNLSFYNTLIYGETFAYDDAATLLSFTEEFLARANRTSVWTRVEILQRTPAELAVLSTDPNTGLWVGAVTVGATDMIARTSDLEFSLGVSVTNDLLPQAYQPTYGGNPWTAKAFIQASGLSMWNL